MAKDILIDPATLDVQIANGDFVIGESEQQHVEHILRADKGHYRQWPLLGVGIGKFLNGAYSAQEVKELITLQLKSDNYNVRQIIVTDDFKVSIDAERIF